MSNSPSKFVPALWGALFIVLISTIPVLNAINMMCCSGIIGGGVIAVHRYRKKGGRVSARVGLELGLYSGLISTSISAIVIIIAMPYLPSLLTFFEGLIDQPDIDNFLEEFSPQMLTSGFLFITIGSSLVINILFSTIGGLIGASFMSTDKKSPNTPAHPDDTIVVEKIDF